MKQNKNKEPMKETTKDDSSDEQKVKQHQSNAQAKVQPENKKRGNEDEQAQKGHA